jgi:hypothetical protein
VKLSRTATNLLGYPYAKEEIINIAARISLNKIGFPLAEINSRPNNAFICSEYVYVCMRSIGVNILFDPRGFISPQDFARTEKLRPLFYVRTKEEEQIIERGMST